MATRNSGSSRNALEGLAHQPRRLEVDGVGLRPVERDFKDGAFAARGDDIGHGFAPYPPPCGEGRPARPVGVGVDLRICGDTPTRAFGATSPQGGGGSHDHQRIRDPGALPFGADDQRIDVQFLDARRHFAKRKPPATEQRRSPHARSALGRPRNPSSSGNSFSPRKRGFDLVPRGRQQQRRGILQQLDQYAAGT